MRPLVAVLALAAAMQACACKDHKEPLRVVGHYTSSWNETRSYGNTRATITHSQQVPIYNWGWSPDCSSDYSCCVSIDSSTGTATHGGCACSSSCPCDVYSPPARTAADPPKPKTQVRTDFERGEAALKEGQYAQAIEHFTQSIQAEPRFEGSYHGRATAKFYLQDYAGALQDCDAALTIRRENPQAWYLKGMVQRAMGDPQAARRTLLTLVRYRQEWQDWDGYYLQLGLCDLALKDYPSAVKEFTQVIQNDPQRVDALYYRGWARYENGEDDSAISDCTWALILDPKKLNAYYVRGLAYQAKGEYGAAIADYGRILELDPKDGDAYFNRGYARIWKSDYAGSIKDFSKAIEINPGDAVAYFYRGWARHSTRNVDDAIADYDSALRIDPRLARAYSSRGIARKETGDLEGARQDFAKAIEVQDPEGWGDLSLGIQPDPNRDPEIVGVPVQRIRVGSAAEAAGIRTGDVLTHFNGVPLEGFDTLRKAELCWMAGEVCELRLLRDGREQVVSCKLRSSR